MNQSVDALVDDLVGLEADLATERGDFSFFGLVLREGASRWHLVVSAPWLDDEGMRSGLDEIAKRLRGGVDPEQFRLISAIIVLEEGDPVRIAFRNLAEVEHDRIRYEEVETPSISIEKMYVITNRCSLNPAA